ncbi:Asp-tRNA(Asn)/Glu-tRNA(Gln) amidotransferase GatCAB subunit A [Rhodococcus sp. ACPA1]|nr:Asp-tRNA(Asn)/Glu-tRNA(Gln) amidotransferase GatCAB subunit A [Rhodococcus sp. ACPA1]
MQTRADGPLAGRTVALEDSVCLAGVPMMHGAAMLRGFIPTQDATVVTWLLDAGAVIAGKAHCEGFSFSGGSHTCAAGPVRNPHNHQRSSGGSSSGCGALVVAGEVDMALAGDQGGSIRMPASWSGAYGLKPTHGLVPYTAPVEATFDHAGPITANVADNALMREVLPGEDELDPRQRNPITHPLSAGTDRRVGRPSGRVLREGFGTAASEPDVDAAVRAAADSLHRLGATVEEISVPAHALGPDIVAPIILEGAPPQLMFEAGLTANWHHHGTGLLDATRGWRDHADDFSESVKITMIGGALFRRRYGGQLYSKALNLVRTLRGAYDEALGRHDLLLLPTMPMKATPLPSEDSPREVITHRAVNTCPFNATGHPAMSVPRALRDGLPVGMMLVGRHFDERSIARRTPTNRPRTGPPSNPRDIRTATPPVARPRGLGRTASRSAPRHDLRGPGTAIVALPETVALSSPCAHQIPGLDHFPPVSRLPDSPEEDTV